MPEQAAWLRVAVLSISLGGTALFPSGTALATEWSDVARDVYVDGRLDRKVQVMTAAGSDRVALVAPSLSRILVFDAETLAVGWLEKSALSRSDDPTAAVSEAEPAADAEATCQRVDEASHLITAGGHTVLVASHQGLAGDVELAELWRTAPVWRRLAAAYEPDPSAVAALAAIDREVELRIVFGTWCGDSKHYVPELLKAVEAAHNPRIRLRLTSIRRGFTEPLDFVRDERITNVPTVLVIEDGREAGRVVETPAAETIEADLAAILAGEVPDHRGRWSRDRLLARGVYRYEDSGAVVGREDWEIFAYDGDRRLLHSRIRFGERTTEIWQRLDAEGRTTFVEITRQGAGETSRSRHWIEDGRLHAVTRGDTTGIIEQTAALPESWTVLLPAAAGAVQGRPGRDAGTHRMAALRLAGAGSPAAGRVEPMELSRLESREVETAAGTFMAEAFERRTAEGATTWFVHPELGMPVAGTTSATERVVLTELEVFTADAASAR